MLTLIRSNIKKFLKTDSQRSNKILKNIILSFGIKGGSIIIGLLLMPITINYVSPLHFGVWLTISSIIGWLSFFDIGMGNGLRNKLAHAIAIQQYEEAKKYVSTTYAILVLISAILLIFFTVIIPLLNWSSILNLPISLNSHIEKAVLIVAFTFCVQFILQIINVVLLAVQETSKANLITLVGQLFVLTIIYSIKDVTEGSLINLVLILTTVPIIIMMLGSIYLYNSELKFIAPSVKKIDIKYAKDIFNMGSIFFIIQIGAIVLFQTNNIIIAQVLGHESVTEFNLAYKIFSVVTMGFVIIVTPYWSASTDAFAKKDYKWIKNSLKLMRKVWLFMAIIAVGLCISSPYIYKIWLNDSIKISTSLTISMTIYVIVLMWQSLHVYLLNGIGKIRLQLILVIISAILNIPFALYLGNIWGLQGIVAANIFFALIIGIILSIQIETIINQKAYGLWNK